jgi:hypothetical protein
VEVLKGVKIMATMNCENCQIIFEGRQNRRYCSIDCRRKAEMKQREIKREERYEAWLAAMTPEMREWYNSLSNASDIFGDLPTLEEIMAIDRPKKGGKNGKD